MLVRRRRVANAAIASTTGVAAEFRRTDCWAVVGTLADGEDETQTGFSFQIGRRVEDLDPEGVAREAVERAARMLGAAKPATQRVPVILDPFAASSFLGLLAGALSAESVLKGRSLFADLVGEAVGSEHVHAGGRRASPRGAGGVAVRRRGGSHRSHRAVHGRGPQRLPARHLHRASQRHAARPATRTARAIVRRPASGRRTSASNRATNPPSELLAAADGGVLIQDVTGVHSGANPISGQFSVGATGLRIAGRRPRRAAPGDDDRVARSPRCCAASRGRQRPAVLLLRRDPVDPDRRDDRRRRLTEGPRSERVGAECSWQVRADGSRSMSTVGRSRPSRSAGTMLPRGRSRSAR